MVLFVAVVVGICCCVAVPFLLLSSLCCSILGRQVFVKAFQHFSPRLVSAVVKEFLAPFGKRYVGDYHWTYVKGWLCLVASTDKRGC